MSKYAQLVEGVLIPAPTQVIKDGFIIKNPKESLLKELGYKPLKYDEVPEITTPGNMLKEVYINQGDYIQVSYEEYTPDPELIIPEPISTEESRELLAFAKMAVNTVELTDKQSLSIKNMYPAWEDFIGKSLSAKFKVSYKDNLYEVRQTIEVVLKDQYPSDNTAALYKEINETNAGTLEDPIPYNNNIELFEGKYYSQSGITYLCTRSTGQPVYNDLNDLVSIYVTKVE